MARLKLRHGSKTPLPPPQKRKPLSARTAGQVRKSSGAVFLPDKEHLVRLIAMKGATDDEIAEQFGVDYETFKAWRRLYPSFNKVLEEGRLSVDADVTVSLFKMTQGYNYEEEATAGKDGDIVTLKKYARPEFGAARYWLENRRPDLWRTASTTRIGGSKEDGPIGMKIETKNDLIDAIVGLLTPKSDGTGKPKGENDLVKR